MEGWRQERLGSRARTHREEEKKTFLQEEKEKKQKNILDTHRPSHGRGLYAAICTVFSSWGESSVSDSKGTKFGIQAGIGITSEP
jgi:hypothetical protein